MDGKRYLEKVVCATEEDEDQAVAATAAVTIRR